MPKVRILKDGLCSRDRIYRAGEVEDDPSPRLLSLATGAMLRGEVVAEMVEEKAAPVEAPPDDKKPKSKQGQ
jgi:hypothetical protein